MAYNDKYKEILDEIWKDKVELDGKTVKEDEEAVKRIKGEALKEKDNPGAFIFPIRLEGKVNENVLADTGSDINIMPYRIYETLGREEMKKIDRGIIMINHTQGEVIGKLSNVLCQVGVTTIITKFLILDIPIDRDAPTVSFIKPLEPQEFDVLRTTKSDSDDEEEYTNNAKWGTVFATGHRSFIEPGTGLRMKRTNCRTRVPIGLYPCHIEEKMTIKEVRGESVVEWKTKVTTKEGIVIKFPRKFRGYKLATEEEVEENEGLKEVWE
ncbi:hypothetical protein Tco_0117563 [Tanacetum coccineum]